MTTNLRNPKECFSIIEDRQFFVLNELALPAGENGSEPLTMHHGTFSRFSLVIINREKKAATANVPVSEWPGIFYNMEQAMRKYDYEQMVKAAQTAVKPEPEKPGSDDRTGPAWTVQIRTGRLKGQTPAQALANPENRQLLINQLKWLQENLAKYPGNRTEIQAISEALKLQEQGKIKAEPVATSSVTLRFGKFSGKTPAAVILEDPVNNLPELQKHLAWLQENLEKYPSNRAQIDAILEAATLYKEGKLQGAAVPAASSSTVIYSTGMRPLVRRTRPDGKSFVYEISIGFSPENKRPVEINIRNYYAPVKKQENGLLLVMASARSDEIRNQFRLSTSQWLWFRHIIESQIRTFEDMNAPALYRAANEADIANRTAAKMAAR